MLRLNDWLHGDDWPDDCYCQHGVFVECSICNPSRFE